MERLNGFSATILKLSEGFLYVTLNGSLIGHDNLLTASHKRFINKIVFSL